MLTLDDHLDGFTAETLRDLARNESAGRHVRKNCIKRLIEKNHYFADHPDFRELRIEIKEEEEAENEVAGLIAQVKEAVIPVVEKIVQKVDVKTEVKPAPKPEEPTGALKASFTTKNM